MSDNGTFDRIAGKTKEAAGKVTGNKETETEGKLQQAEGKITDELGLLSGALEFSEETLADAAAALVACNALWGTGLSLPELSALAARLGADVPFPLTGATAVGSGRGDLVTPIMTRGVYPWVFAPAGGAARLTPGYWADRAISGAYEATSMSAAVIGPLLVDCGICALFAVAVFSVAVAVGRARARSAL